MGRWLVRQEKQKERKEGVSKRWGGKVDKNAALQLERWLHGYAHLPQKQEDLSLAPSTPVKVGCGHAHMYL